MKNRRFLYGIFLVAILMIAIFAVFVPPVGIPETEDITKFEHIDIDLPDNSYGFYYSFIPDGSGIVYVDSLPLEYSGYQPAKFIYYHLDFKSKHSRVIHEIVIPEIDFNQQVSNTPVVYWWSARTPFLGVEGDYGQCTSEFLYDTITFDLDTDKKASAVCSFGTGGTGLTNPEISTGHPQIFTLSNPKQYKEIHSADKQYYFLWKIEFDCFFLTCLGEPGAKNYIEIFNANDKMIRRIYLGETGQMSMGPIYTGYVGFWSNTNEIVVIPDVGSWIQPISYKVYFIDPEK